MAMLRRALVLFQQNLTLAGAVHSIRSPLRPQYGLLSRLSTDCGSYEVDLSNEESKRRLFNRLVYRSKQRGFLELDLVLGNWVEENIRSMDELRIKALIDVLDLENPDLWKWLTGQEQPPDAVNNNPVFNAVKSKVIENLSKHSDPATRSIPGQPWVRGWDDKRGLDGPKFGNQ